MFLEVNLFIFANFQTPITAIPILAKMTVPVLVMQMGIAVNVSSDIQDMTVKVSSIPYNKV